MSSRKSTVDLSAKLTADVRQYDAEMKRAAAVTASFEKVSAGSLRAVATESKRFESEIDRSMSGAKKEVSGFARFMERELSGAKIGKAMLSGFGIGSAMQLTDTAIGAIANIWKEAAEHARAVQERAKEISDIIAQIKPIRLAMADAERSPEEQLAFRKSEVERIKRDLAVANEEAARANRGMLAAQALPRGEGITRFEGEDFGFKNKEGRFIGGLPAREFDDLMSKRADDAAKATARLNVELAKTLQEIQALEAPAKKAALNNAVQDFFLPVDDAGGMAQRQAATKLDWDLATSRRQELQKQVESGNKLFLDAEAKRISEAEKSRRAEIELEFDLAAARNKQLREQVESGNKIYMEGLEAKKKAAEEFDRHTFHIFKHAADGMADAFEDFFSGAKDGWKDLGDSILNEVKRIMIQVMFVRPMMNMIGSGFNAMGWTQMGSAFTGTAGGVPAGGLFADGGRPPVGHASIVGERGPELFIPDRPGTIIPNHALAGNIGGPTQTVVFNNYFEAGVTPQQLGPLLHAHEQRVRGSILAAQERGQRG